MTAVNQSMSSVLRTGISGTTHDGNLHAIVELHGELCALSAAELRTELDQLVDDDIVDMTVDLQHLRLCTSHGLDVFDHVHHRLQQRHRGKLWLRLDGAPSTVKKIVHLVHDQDQTFSPRITETARGSESMAPHERLGDSTY